MRKQAWWPGRQEWLDRAGRVHIETYVKYTWFTFIYPNRFIYIYTMRACAFFTESFLSEALGVSLQLFSTPCSKRKGNINGKKAYIWSFELTPAKNLAWNPNMVMSCGHIISGFFVHSSFLLRRWDGQMPWSWWSCWKQRKAHWSQVGEPKRPEKRFQNDANS